MTIFLHKLSRPPEIELDLIAQTFAARTARLDPKHPLRTRVNTIIRTGANKTRLARLVLALPKAETVNPLAHPPWLVREPRAAIAKRISGPQGRTKESAAKDFLDFLATLPLNDIQVFSDGSKREDTDGATGGGSVTYQGGQQTARNAFSLGYNAEVFDAEAAAALHGARAALESHTARFATDLWVFLDNLEVATRLLAPSASSSQSVFDEFCKVAQQWPLRTRLPHVLPGAVRIRWVPGHLNVPGNDAADAVAKEGAALPAPANALCTLASLKRIAKAAAKAATIKHWAATAPANYTELIIGPSRNSDELLLQRASLGRILAARTQHGDFAAYHNRFNHLNATLDCSCGYPKSPLHFFFCRHSTARELADRAPASEAIPWLLGTATGAKKLASWITDSNYFTDICPRHARAIDL